MNAIDRRVSAAVADGVKKGNATKDTDKESDESYLKLKKEIEALKSSQIANFNAQENKALKQENKALKKLQKQISGLEQQLALSNQAAQTPAPAPAPVPAPAPSYTMVMPNYEQSMSNRPSSNNFDGMSLMTMLSLMPQLNSTGGNSSPSFSNLTQGPTSGLNTGINVGPNFGLNTGINVGPNFGLNTGRLFA